LSLCLQNSCKLFYFSSKIERVKQIDLLIQKLDKWQQKHHFTAFIYAVIKKYGEDGAGYKAALLTYYGFLSLFPLLLLLTTITNSILRGHPDLQNTIINGLTDYFPLLGNQLSDHVHSLRANGIAFWAGVAFLLYGARGVADVWRHGIQDVWSVPRAKREGFPLGTLKNLATVIVGGLGFLLASVSAAMAAAAGHGWGFRGLSILINLLILFLLFIFLLNISLPRHISVKEIRVGAATGAIGLVILQLLGGYILSRELKSLDALYSYFALALGLLFWIYLQAQMLYYAAEIAVVSSKRLWPRSFSDPPLDRIP
jgi:YihY family inner membrane protein